jgi:DNA recombination protein RmuC
MTPLGIALLAAVALLAGALLLVLSRGAVTRKEVEGIREELRKEVACRDAALSTQVAQLGGLLQGQFEHLTKQVGEQLRTTLEVAERSSGRLDERLDKATAVIGEVRQALGALSEANARIYEVGRDISSLQEILRSPKLRGGLGELFLGDLLAEVLPQGRYALQYAFKGGETVDAVIRLAQHLVPVDAKFPLESFARLKGAGSEEERLRTKRELMRDVRKHIDAIAQKYIRPAEGTLDFALMYIPAENVYYEVITRDERLPEECHLFPYALSRRVVPVSPNSFFAYLQTILLGLSGLRLAENIQAVLGHLSALREAFAKIEGDYDLVYKHFRHAIERLQEARDHLTAFSRELSALTRVEADGSPSLPADK